MLRLPLSSSRLKEGKSNVGMKRGMVDIPKMMKAAAVDRFGGPEVLKVHKVPVPSLDDDRQRV